MVLLVFLAADAGFFVVEAGDLSFASVVLEDSLLLEDSSLDVSVAVVLLAFLTAVGGGTIRDILINRVPSILVSEFYATVALILASIIFVLEILHLRSLPVITLVFIFGVALRLLAYYRKWHLPTLSKEN